jgi:hypothetical protein
MYYVNKIYSVTVRIKFTQSKTLSKFVQYPWDLTYFRSIYNKL